MNEFIKPEMQEFIGDFLIESKELIENIDNDLVVLEKEPGNDECLNNVFRAVHTIKGTSSFMGLEKISGFSHELENVLNLLRNKQIVLDSQIIDVVLESLDLIKALLEDIENGFDSSISVASSSAKLGEIMEFGSITEKEKSKTKTSAEKPVKASKENSGAMEDSMNSSREGDEQKKNTGILDELENKKIGQILLEKGLIKKEDIEEALSKQYEQPKIGEILISEGKISEESLQEALQSQGKTDIKTETTMRVEVKRLDVLMNNVGELVLARNRLMQISKHLEDLIENEQSVKKLAELANNLDLLTTDIHTSLMKVRMVPIAKLFSKCPRMVRDLSRNTKKEIELETFGENTELDKSIAEELNDPLLHLIRNSIDHGIETPVDRKSKGKKAKGTITLGAYQKSNSIVIEIKDDGQGINTEKVLKKAVDKKIITPGEAASMPTSRIYQLILAPGFSTAEIITDISGRGVGMDVVKTNIEKLRGSIDILSEAGRGTTIQLRIPVTLEIMQALIVKIYEESFALPLASITNVIDLKESDIETINGREVLNMKNGVLSLIRLGDLFNINIEEKKEKKFAVLLDVTAYKVGLIVSAITSKEEIVIKNLDSKVRNSKYISGATILGDGSVSLVIDVTELLKTVMEKRQ